MTVFYTLPGGLTIAASLLALFCAMAQAALIVCLIFRYGTGKGRWEELLLECAILLQTLLYVCLIARVRMNETAGYAVADVGARTSRWVVAALMLLYACAAAWRVKKAAPILCAAVAALTLPPMERLPASAFAAGYLAAVVFFLTRAAVRAARTARQLKKEISAYSVKKAIDALASGVMFCADDGSVLLMNRRMRAVMRAFTGRLRRNGAAFWRALETGECRAQRLPHEKRGEFLYRTAQGTVLLFADVPVRTGRRRCRQITVSDVTEYWTATQELERRQQRLREDSERLHAMLLCVQSVCRGEETLRMKSRFHDVLGQRIALLARTLRDGMLPPQSFFDELGAVLDGGAMDREYPTGKERLLRLREAMADIGVTVEISGELPADAAAARLFCDLMTEGTTNAVRHGLAGTVWVRMCREDGFDVIRVTNDGAPASADFALRGGLSTLKKRTQALGGTFRAAAGEKFTVEARLPREGEQS